MHFIPIAPQLQHEAGKQFISERTHIHFLWTQCLQGAAISRLTEYRKAREKHARLLIESLFCPSENRLFELAQEFRRHNPIAGLPCLGGETNQIVQRLPSKSTSQQLDCSRIASEPSDDIGNS